MKKMLFLLLACSMAFAQTDYTGLRDDADAAYAELDRETQVGPAQAQGEDARESVWDNPDGNTSSVNSGYTVDASVKESSPVTAAPATPREETWEEAWQKRRFNISFFVGFLPFTAIIEAFVHDKDKEPDVTAYSVAIGWELFYLAELSLMANYTTVAGHALYTVTPRIKLNYLNFKYFRLYSYFGLGGIFWDGGSYLMFNFALLGAEIGGPISVFFEHGWGQVGMLTAGVKIAF